MKLVRVMFLQSHCVVDAMDRVKGVPLRQLPPLTTLLVRTRKSLYRIVVTEGANVYVQGGRFFPDPTSACIDGASGDGFFQNAVWIAVGLPMKIRAGGKRIVTSRVRAITTERPAIAVVH